MVLKVLASAEKQGKEIQITSIKQRETKSSLFTDNCVIEIETILQIILTTKGVSKILNTESVALFFPFPSIYPVTSTLKWIVLT